MSEPSASLRHARVMTYNVHGFVGTDGACDPERIAAAIEQSAPDLVALQEVEFGESERDQRSRCEWLGKRLGMHCHFTLTRPGLSGGQFGNAVLSRHAFELISEGTLPRRGGEPRAVQWLKIRAPHQDFYLMNTHLGVWFWQRYAQIRALLGAEWLIRAGTDLPLVVCGDFNATPLSFVYRALARDLLDVQSCARQRFSTWPSSRPLMRIDHMFVSREFRVQACAVERNALTRIASDHLPLLAVLEWGDAPERAAGASDDRAPRAEVTPNRAELTQVGAAPERRPE
jgi:endonuclease/exonuclease/phosphatase family metal-dependent hydrolase